jgi:AraC-like DNA-binding protein
VELDIETSSHLYPIHTFNHQGEVNFNFDYPSAKYKNIIPYYQQVSSLKNANKKFIYPTGSVGLVFRCDLHKPGAFLVGTPTLPREAEYTNVESTTYFIILFWPGVSYAFYPLPAKELTDKSIPLGELLPSESERIVELIVTANSFQERIHIFEQFLDKRLLLQEDIPKSILIAITTICRNFKKLSCVEVERQTRYTDRHFRRLFDKYIGVSPIMLKKIMRYQKTLKALYTRPKEDMAGLAFELGYFDQSHLIREFKRFQSCTPKHFLSLFNY